MRALLDRLLHGDHLGFDGGGEILRHLVDPGVAPELKSAVLVALRLRGEAPDVVSGMAAAMLAVAVPVSPPRDLPLVDTCGTGGDGKHTINVSTGAALVVAATGKVRVAKHGNRAVSSRAGSADVLEALGITLHRGGGEAAAALHKHGFAFLFAPAFHPAMAHLAPVRRALGVRTVMNLLGPLTNPARPDHQIVGAFDVAAAEKIALVLARLGGRGARVVTGAGYDEATPIAPFMAWDIGGGEVECREVDPAEYGFARCADGDLAGGSASENADALLQVFSGAHGPHRDAIALNAILTLEVAGVSRAEATVVVRDVLDQGEVLRLIESLRRRA